MANFERKVIDKKDEEPQVFERKIAQTLTFEQANALLQRNVRRATNRRYTQYTKESIKTYLQNPGTSIDNIREISRFLERNSMLYKKLLLYYAISPLYSYNLVQNNDWSTSVNAQTQTKDYLETARVVNGFNLKVNMFFAMYLAIRDGAFFGFTYTNNDKTFFQILDPQYCRVYGKNEEGQWIVYFNAAYFSGNNEIFVTGIDGDGEGVWDQVFVDGYNAYQNDRNAQWFELPPERTCCLLSVSDDLADVPLPFFAPMFLSLIDLSDFEQLIADKTELENYKLLVNKIPLKEGTDMVNDWALSMEIAQKFDNQFESAVPDLVGHVLSPGFEMEVIDFEKSNTTEDNDILAQSIDNIFNQTGISKIVVAGGGSTSSIAVKHSIQNDEATMWMFINRLEDWLNFWIQENVSEGYTLRFHRCTWYSADEYITRMQNIATLGGSAMDLLTVEKTPYEAYQQIQFENMLGIKDLLRPLSTSYTQSGTSDEGGRPKNDDDDLTEEGVETREKRAANE